MGLDVSHECWSGSYSRFNNFRREIAKAIGMDWDKEMEMAEGSFGKPPTKSLEDVFAPYIEDPLVDLLWHSDCDGEIGRESQLPLAGRLREIAQQLGDGWEERAIQFAIGLENAYGSNETVEFA